MSIFDMNHSIWYNKTRSTSNNWHQFQSIVRVSEMLKIFSIIIATAGFVQSQNVPGICYCVPTGLKL